MSGGKLAERIEMYPVDEIKAERLKDKDAA